MKHREGRGSSTSGESAGETLKRREKPYYDRKNDTAAALPIDALCEKPEKPDGSLFFSAKMKENKVDLFFVYGSINVTEHCSKRILTKE